MKRLLLLAVILNVACSRQTSNRAPDASNSRIAETVSATQTPAPAVEYLPDQFGTRVGGSGEDIEYTRDDRLSYRGYEMVKRVKRVKIGEPDSYSDIEYADLKKDGKVVARFGDGAGEPHSSIRFGLFNFVGGRDEQFIVEQTANKFWRYWIVNLSPAREVVYDSGKYDLVFELSASDFDGDGRYEIVQHLGTFWYFMANNVDSTRPPVILAYEDGARRYVPASPKFQNVLLADIEQRIGKVRELKRKGGVGMLDVVVRYLYAGKEREGWEFFEQECGGCPILYGDKPLRAELKKKLKQDAFYREVSGMAR